MGKKILIVNNGYPSKLRPQYTAYIKSIRDAIKDAGYTVEILVLDTNFKGRCSKLFSYIKYYFKLITFTKYKEFDYIYVHNFPYSAIPIFLRSKSMSKMAIHWHGSDIFGESLRASFFNWISYRLLPKGVIHIAPSDYFARSVSESLNIDYKEILVSPSGGVDCELFINNKESQKRNVFRIGFASHVSKEKGFDLFHQLIESSSELEKTCNAKFQFHFIEYGKDFHVYKEKFNDLNNVISHSMMSKNKMPDYYSSIDVLVMPTQRKAESLGLVSLEAMACGVPVLASDGFASQEFIISGITGEKFATGNYDELINKLKIIIDNYPRYRPRNIVEEKYSNSTVSDGYKKIFT